MNLNALKALFAVLFVYMIYTVITTSLQSNLFAEWSYLGSIPWMRATLIDFYTNIVVLWAWVAYKETSWAVRLLWLVLFVCLGSITVTLYVLIELFRLKPGEGIERVLLRRANA
jgi:hypothetical protein